MRRRQNEPRKQRQQTCSVDSLSTAVRRRSGKQSCRVWLGRAIHWHLEVDITAGELQQNTAKNEAKSGPLSLFRAWACSGKAKSRQHTEGGGAAGMQSVAEYDTTPALGETHRCGGAAAGHGQERGEERATLAFPRIGMLRKSQESPADRRRRRRQQEAGTARRVWLSRKPHWHTNL